jgi:hypothetical protein
MYVLRHADSVNVHQEYHTIFCTALGPTSPTSLRRQHRHSGFIQQDGYMTWEQAYARCVAFQADLITIVAPS